MFRKPRPAALGAVVALALTVGLSACQAGAEAPAEISGSPSASPTPTTSPSPSVPPTPENPAKAAKAKNIAEAKQRYLEFQEITTAKSKKGQSPFSELMSGGYIGSSELQSQQQSFWEQYTDLKLKQVGEASIEVVEVTKYEGDPLLKDVTGQRVYMKVCIDNSGRDVVNPDGTSALRKDSPDRVLMTAVMQGQKQEGIWSVNETTSTGKAC
ncbi:hypothetical protein APR04_003477 [Promicromonospora umidemergens]|uniref:Lipoprotein n=1 Tax=Promicromonospora umidemergens TaxID=629679 RepID=A0ABP8Y3Z9_9MICO|nr:hypothetical protein [Promicromonospora umidemergens]MCP2284554.1 hypothetical protein [Promicromonospora umidemergens]